MSLPKIAHEEVDATRSLITSELKTMSGHLLITAVSLLALSFITLTGCRDDWDEDLNTPRQTGLPNAGTGGKAGASGYGGGAATEASASAGTSDASGPALAGSGGTGETG